MKVELSPEAQNQIQRALNAIELLTTELERHTNPGYIFSEAKVYKSVESQMAAEMAERCVSAKVTLAKLKEI